MTCVMLVIFCLPVMTSKRLTLQNVFKTSMLLDLQKNIINLNLNLCSIMKNVKKIVTPVLFLIGVLTLIALIPSCNVTRTVTTTSQHVQRGDTTTIIQTKTIESYDASKR